MAISSATIPSLKLEARPSARRRPWKFPKALKPYLMLAPGIVLFLAFMAAPIVYTFVLSFQKKQVIGLGLGAGAQGRAWAGLSNYVGSLTNPEFLASIGRVLLYGAILVPFMLGFALLFALLLDSKRTRAKSFSRTSI